MYIKNIQLNNFRNYEREDIMFGSNYNIIIAKNGMGKSNLLEAIYYMSHIRPFRNVTDNELKRKGQKFFSIKSQYINNKNLNSDLKIFCSDKKNIISDDKKIHKHSDVLGKILTVLFKNDDIMILTGAPAIKRKFFDIFISIIDKNYINSLREYNKILEKKNFCLRNKQASMIDLYNIQLSESIFYIQNKRKEIIKVINEKFGPIFKEIGEYDKSITIKYKPSLNIDEISRENIVEVLGRKKNDELNKGYSLVGIHKDNYNFYINNYPFEKYASFGQSRLAALSLKIIQSLLYKTYFNTEPVLLLDDVILELDLLKKNNFIKYISGDNQIFLTVTEKKYIDFFKNKDKLNIIEVDNGKIL